MGQKRIGDLLVDAGVLSEEALRAVLARQMTEGHGRVASEIFALGLAHERQLCEALARSSGHPAVVLSESTFDLSPLALIPTSIAETHALLPIAMDETSLTVAVADVDSRAIFEQLSLATARRIVQFVAVEHLLMAAIPKAYSSHARGKRWLVGPQSPVKDGFHLATARVLPSIEDEVTALVGLLLHAEEPRHEELPRVAPRETPPALPKSDEAPAPSGSSNTAVARIGLRRVAVSSRDRSPMAGGTAPPEAPSRSAARPPEGEALGADPPHLLVVEDDPSIRDLLQRVLTHDGYQVSTATNGHDAVERIRFETPRLMLLDAMLPGMHGFEICARLKSSEIYREVPIVMISAVYRGWRRARDIQEVHGADAFVEKPFDVHYVRKLVAELLGRPLARNQPPEDRAAYIERLRLHIREYWLLEEWRAALEQVSDWLQIDPFDPLAYLEKGKLLTELGELDGALHAYECAAVFDPKLFPAQVHLAAAYDQLGFSRKATETWRRARGLATDDDARERIDWRLAQGS